MRRLAVLGLLLVLTACSSGEGDGEGDRDARASDAPASAAGSDGPTEPDEPRPSRVPIQPGDQRIGFTLPDGTDGSYLLHAPASFGSDSQLALVLVFHGAPGTPRQMVHATGFSALADEESFIVVYPDALDSSTDVAALIDDVTHRTAIDLGKIYATGFSRGASTTYLLAAELADRIAAFAPVSGISYDLPTGEPTSLIAFQGEADQLASAFPAVNATWARGNRCGRPATTTLTFAGRPTRRSVAECRAGTDHVVYRVQDMGHEWPRGASPLIWQFFATHELAR
jgi:polyhydroxybutyrate depolymerase